MTDQRSLKLVDNPDTPPEQENLFGLEIVEWSEANTGTVHLKAFALASDGMEYAIKRVSDGVDSGAKVKFPKLIPASEWFCYKLAEKCGIATPVCRLLFDPETKEYVFGSRIELAASQQKDHRPLMISLLKKPTSVLLKQLWQIQAFDQFVYNIDRHINNYLYSQGRYGVTVQAFDFSLSAFVFGWPTFTNEALPSDCNTVVNWNAIKDLTGVTADYKEAAFNVLDRLAALKSEHIEQIIAEMPEEWLHQSLMENLINWWDSRERIDKIELIRAEIGNE
ncbi:TPA: hypothetical protein ACPJ0R_001199 [Vibrio diabolicus]